MKRLRLLLYLNSVFGGLQASNKLKVSDKLQIMTSFTHHINRHSIDLGSFLVVFCPTFVLPLVQISARTLLITMSLIVNKVREY